jgi:hypothetical protein
MMIGNLQTNWTTSSCSRLLAGMNSDPNTKGVPFDIDEITISQHDSSLGQN